MHTTPKLGATLALGLLLLPAPASASTSIVELTPMPNGSSGTPTDINDHDVIAGAGNVGTGNFVRHAVRWSAGGHLTDLGALPGEPFSEANAINGVIVGNSGSNNGERAVKWTENGLVTALPTLPGAKFCDATDINDQGVVVGRCGDSRLRHQGRAVRWNTDGTITDLGTLPGHLGSVATGVNEEGVIVGDITSAKNQYVPAVWEYTEADELPLHTDAGPGSINVATASNNSNVIIGRSGDKAVRWRY